MQYLQQDNNTVLPLQSVLCLKLWHHFITLINNHHCNLPHCYHHPLIQAPISIFNLCTCFFPSGSSTCSHTNSCKFGKFHLEHKSVVSASTNSITHDSILVHHNLLHSTRFARLDWTTRTTLSPDTRTRTSTILVHNFLIWAELHVARYSKWALIFRHKIT